MSRIGKKILDIPQGTEVSVKDSTFSVKGKNGELVRTFNDIVVIKNEDGKVWVEPKNKTKFARAMWGTAASHITNMDRWGEWKIFKNTYHRRGGI